MEKTRSVATLWQPKRLVFELVQPEERFGFVPRFEPAISIRLPTIPKWNAISSPARLDVVFRTKYGATTLETNEDRGYPLD